jgi:hypothetical protein
MGKDNITIQSPITKEKILASPITQEKVISSGITTNLIIQSPIGIEDTPPLFDIEVSSWETRVLANGGTISATTKDRVNTFVLAVKAAGLRSRFLRLNLFVGDNLAAGLTPLFLNGDESLSVFLGNTYDANNNFIGGDYSESGVSGGLQGNGSNKYADTGFSPLGVSALGLNTAGLLVYCRTETPSGTLIGGSSQIAPQSQFRILSLAGLAPGLFFQGVIPDSVADARGVSIGARFNASDMTVYKDGAVKVVRTSGVDVVKKPDTTVAILAQNQDAVTNSYSNALLNCYAIIDSVADDAEAATISTLLNDFYTNFSRNEY